jgi:hypothetical protein
MKSAGFAPETEIPVIARFAFPELVKVTVCAIEVEPTERGAKEGLEGEKETVGTPAVPLRVTKAT